MKKLINKRSVCLGITAVAIILLLLIEIFGIEPLFGKISDEALETGINTTLTRFIGGAVFLTLIAYSGFKILSPVKKPFFASVLFCLPAFAVAVNNLPIYSLLKGLAYVTSPPWRVLLLALECMAVGLFEETCFRGFVFVSFLEKRRGTKWGQFMAIVLSSAVFALVHLFNLFLGASPVAVILQLGYSFLIGAMCAVMLMKTANIWLCVIAHGVFNFCGALIPDCGKGSIWEIFTVVITVVVSVIVAAYFVYMFLKIRSEETDKIYK